MSVLERPTLEASSLADLHAIASELSVDGYRRLRKPELIETLLSHQDDGEAGPVAGAEDSDAEETASTASRRKRGRRGGRSRTTAAGSDADDAQGAGAEESGKDGQAAKAPKRGAGEPAQAPKAAASEPAKDTVVEGVIELMPNGSGFLRLAPPEPSDDDVYISAAQVKRCELINGDRVSGPRRAPHRSERFPSLVRIDTVNGRPAAEIGDRGRFDEIPAAFPQTRFKLGGDDPTLKAIDTLAPFGRGSRVVITGSAWSGKSHALRLLAGSLVEQKDVTVLLALAGVRPEELNAWSDGPVTTQTGVSFAASVDAQTHAAEAVVEQAKRLAARGEHAIVLIDTLDGLAELAVRKLLASARNIVGGGSLTIVATASAPVGGETTVIALDRERAIAGAFPAIDVSATGTLHAELLVTKTALAAIARERAKTA